MSKLYDYDLFSHTIQIRDWYHDIIDVRYPGYNKDRSLIGLTPVSYLINGMGRYMVGIRIIISSFIAFLIHVDDR